MQHEPAFTLFKFIVFALVVQFLSSRGTSATTSFIAQEDLTLHLDVRGSFLFMWCVFCCDAGVLSRLSIEVALVLSLSFECKDIERVLDIVELHDLARGMRTLSIAGGGAYRLYNCFSWVINVCI